MICKIVKQSLVMDKKRKEKGQVAMCMKTIRYHAQMNDEAFRGIQT